MKRCPSSRGICNFIGASRGVVLVCTGIRYQSINQIILFLFLYSPSLVRRQCRRLAFHWMVFPVRIRIHWGSGRFWRCFLARVRLVRKDFWDG